MKEGGIFGWESRDWLDGSCMTALDKSQPDRFGTGEDGVTMADDNDRQEKLRLRSREF